MPSCIERDFTSSFCPVSAASAAACQIPYSKRDVLVAYNSRHLLSSTICFNRLLKHISRNRPKTDASRSAKMRNSNKNRKK
eukprot:Skav201981  [mRNA]  locus=scaffold2336:106502:106744:- [translate_table: standard]